MRLPKDFMELLELFVVELTRVDTLWCIQLLHVHGVYDISCVFSISALRLEFSWLASDVKGAGQVLVAACRYPL